MKTPVVGLVTLWLLLLVMRLSSPSNPPGTTPDEPPPTAVNRARMPERGGDESARAVQPPPHRDVGIGMTIHRIELEPDADRRSGMLEEAATAPAPADLAAVLDSILADPRPAAVELSSLLLQRWTRNAPGESAVWAARLPEGPARQSAIKQVAVAWAESDLAAVTGWVRGLPRGADRDGAALSLGYEAARTDPIMALEWAGELQPTRERDDMILHAVSQWANTDSTTAMSWSAMVADPVLRQRLLAAVAVGGAEQDGAGSSDLIARALSGTDDQDRALIAVVQRWSQTSPAAAAAWISDLHESEVRDEAARTLIQLWTPQDEQASGWWVHSLPDGSLRNISLAAHGQAMADGAMAEPALIQPAGLDPSQ